MTFKNLLLQCEFENVAGSIGELYEGQAGMLSLYKEVFDRLRHMESIPSVGKISVEWEENALYPRVYGCCEGSVEEILGKEVQAGIGVSQDELAAHCLREFTSYGFSDEDVDDLLVSWEGAGHTHYGKRAHDLELKYYRGLVYSKKAFYRYKTYKFRGRTFKVTAFYSKVFDEIRFREKHCNRIRHKRNYRIAKRIAELQHKDETEWLVERLTAHPSPDAFSRNHLDFLFSASRISEIRFHSYAYDVKKRVSYLRELMEKYSFYSFHGYALYLVLITTSPEFPVLPGESLEFMAEHFPEEAEVRWGFDYNDNLGQEMKVLIVCVD